MKLSNFDEIRFISKNSAEKIVNRLNSIDNQYLNDENKALCITKCKDGHAISFITYYENGQLMSKHTYMKKFGNSRFYENGSLMYESKETPELSSIGYERSFNSDSSITDFEASSSEFGKSFIDIIVPLVRSS